VIRNRNIHHARNARLFAGLLHALVALNRRRAGQSAEENAYITYIQTVHSQSSFLILRPVQPSALRLSFWFLLRNNSLCNTIHRSQLGKRLILPHPYLHLSCPSLRAKSLAFPFPLSPSPGMATIRIADPIRPTRADNSSSSTTAVGGVYPIRTNSLDRRSIRSNDRRGVKLNDAENLDDENGLRQQGDFKKRQVLFKMAPGTATDSR
jgi:hypothetical protein